MKTSSSAWVGCSCLPSPALITEASVQRGDQPGGAGVRGADHDRRRVVGGERRDRVLQRLALVDRGAGRLDADDVGREPLGGELEGGEGSGAGLVEEVDDGAAAQRRDLLDVAPADLGEALRRGRGCAPSPRARAPPLRAGASWRPPSHGRVSGRDRDLVDAVGLLEADVDPLAAARSAGSCRRSRGGSGARGGRGRQGRRAGPGPGARSRRGRRSPLAPCGPV